MIAQHVCAAWPSLAYFVRQKLPTPACQIHARMKLHAPLLHLDLNACVELASQVSPVKSTMPDAMTTFVKMEALAWTVLRNLCVNALLGSQELVVISRLIAAKT